jgi:hypothetical protein
VLYFFLFCFLVLARSKLLRCFTMCLRRGYFAPLVCPSSLALFSFTHQAKAVYDISVSSKTIIRKLILQTLYIRNGPDRWRTGTGRAQHTHAFGVCCALRPRLAAPAPSLPSLHSSGRLFSSSSLLLCPVDFSFFFFYLRYCVVSHFLTTVDPGYS